MSTTVNLTVKKGLPYQIRVRAPGKWDSLTTQTFTTEGESVSVSTTNYDGLDMDYEVSYQSADKVDFSNTLLPWKWGYSTTLSTNRYCLMPLGQNYENVVDGDTVATETLPGCTYHYEDDGSTTTLNCFAIDYDQSVVLTPDDSYGVITKNYPFSGTLYVDGAFMVVFEEGTFERYDWQWNHSYETIGHPTDASGTISDFSTNDYVQSEEAFNPGSKMWEMAISGMAGTIGAEQGIIQSDGFKIGIDSSGHPFGTFYADDGSEIGTSTSDLVVGANGYFHIVTSYVKFNWENQYHYKITAYHPDTGMPFDGNTVWSSETIKPGLFKFGLSTTKVTTDYKNIFKGTLCLWDTGIEIIGDDWNPEWTWYADEGSYEVIGNPTIGHDEDDETMVTVSNFSAGNYIKANVSFEPLAKKWYAFASCIVGNVGTRQIVLDTDGLQIGIDENGHAFATFIGADGVIGTSTVTDYSIHEGDKAVLVAWYMNSEYMCLADIEGEEPAEGNVISSETPIKSGDVNFGMDVMTTKATLLGTVLIPSHTVYEYDNGTWTEKNSL